MRPRGEKASGVIRPRTLGLGKVPVSPEPLPPPLPPATAHSQLFQNRRARLALLAGSLILFIIMLTRGGGSDSNAVQSQLPLDTSSNSALRSAQDHSNNDDDDGGDDEEDAPPVKGNKKKPIVDDDEEETEDEKHDDEETEVDDEESTGNAEQDEDRPSPSASKDVESPVRSSQRFSGSDNSRDRSKTVESYFVNFGGRVVDIDREGSYKYVLVRMEDLFGNQALLVRGCPHREGTHCKHNDAFSRAKAELELRGFKATVLGGGRITRHPSRHQKGQKEGYISIFGHSKTFGACEECNKLTCSLVKAAIPEHGVKWANEGYLESDERKIRDDAWSRC